MTWCGPRSSVVRPARPGSAAAGAALVAASVLIAAGARAEAKPKDLAPPAALEATIALGPPSTFAGLYSFLDAIKPGISGELRAKLTQATLAQTAGLSSADGLDPASTTYLLVVDDKPVLLARFTDAAKLLGNAGELRVLTQGGWAVVGPKPALDAVGKYALNRVAAQPAPNVPTAEIYVAAMLKRFGPQLHKIREQMQSGPMAAGGPMMTQMMTMYVEGLSSLAADSQSVVVRLEASAQRAWLDIALSPRPGSRLLNFIEKQHPTDHALLRQLPAGPLPMMVMSGHLEAGPYRDSVIKLIASMYTGATSKQVAAVFQQMQPVLTGDVAGAFSFGAGGMTFSQIAGVTDPKPVQQSIRTLVAQFIPRYTTEVANATITLTGNADTTLHDGVVLHSYDAVTDYSKAPPAQRQLLASMAGNRRIQLAAFDKVFMMVSDQDSVAAANQMIDAARSKGAHLSLSTSGDELLAASQSHRDSAVMLMNLGALAKMIPGTPDFGVTPIMLSLGFADRNAHIGFTVSAASVRTVMQIAKP